MKQTFLLVAVFAAAFAGFHVAEVSAANAEPKLSGSGCVVFQGSTPPATVCVSAGGVTVSAAGTNQNVVLTPSGSGYTLPGGNVGIGGITTPLTPLHVLGPSGVTSFASSTRLGVTITGPTSNNDYAGIDFTGGTGVPRARIGAVYTNSGSFLRFGTSNNYGSGITNTGVSIDFNGNLGAGGNTSPGFAVDATGVVNASSGFSSGGTAGYNTNITVKGSSGSNCTITMSHGIITNSGC